MKITLFRTLLITLCALVAGPALAAPRDDALAGISRCAGLTDDRMFLDCLYGAAQPLRAELGLPSASPAQIRLVPPALTPASPQVAKEMALASGALHMTSYEFGPTGRFTVTLNNGEVWGEAPQDSRLARWKKPAGAYLITVAKNWAGSYQLDVKGDHTYFVQQVK